MELPLWRKLRKISRRINQIADLIHYRKLEITEEELVFLIQEEIKNTLKGEKV